MLRIHSRFLEAEKNEIVQWDPSFHNVSARTWAGMCLEIVLNVVCVHVWVHFGVHFGVLFGIGFEAF